MKYCTFSNDFSIKRNVIDTLHAVQCSIEKKDSKEVFFWRGRGGGGNLKKLTFRSIPEYTYKNMLCDAVLQRFGVQYVLQT